MTDKLHCPFCGFKLERSFGYLFCPNNDCQETNHFNGSQEIWQALISGKVAKDTLDKIKETVDAFRDSEFAEDMRDCVRTISRMLTSITKQDNKNDR